VTTEPLPSEGENVFPKLLPPTFELTEKVQRVQIDKAHESMKQKYNKKVNAKQRYLLCGLCSPAHFQDC
jgi:hypothetical protein